MKFQRTAQSGFTLVELVLVIVLLGIISVASTQFIRQGVGIYTDSVERDRLQQMARFAIERMSRELRNALPGSVRTSVDGSCVEFMPIKGASTYLEPAADGPRTTLNVVDFSYVYSAPGAGEPDDLLAIYPIASNNIYSSPSVLATLTDASTPASGQQTLAFDSFGFPDESPTQRFFIVTEPVSFCAADNALTRHQGYARSGTQPVPPANGILLAENIRLNDNGTSVTVFDFTAGTPQRSGVIHLDMRFSNDVGDEWIRFSQEVFVRNTP